MIQRNSDVTRPARRYMIAQPKAGRTSTGTTCHRPSLRFERTRHTGERTERRPQGAKPAQMQEWTRASVNGGGRDDSMHLRGRQRGRSRLLARTAFSRRPSPRHAADSGNFVAATLFPIENECETQRPIIEILNKTVRTQSDFSCLKANGNQSIMDTEHLTFLATLLTFLTVVLYTPGWP